MDVPAAHGGRDARVLDQVAVWEQLGRVTNALCWCFSEPHRWMFEACSPEQLERYVLPLMSGKRKECYAITESGSGSDVEIQTSAQRCPGGYRIRGEKWYVTSANHADYFILEARLADGPHAGSHSLFFIDKDQPGIELVRTPAFSHTFSDHHPIYRFRCRGAREPAPRRGGRRHAARPELVSPRAIDDRGALLRRGRPPDRGGERIRCARAWSAVSRWLSGR